jgi:hypothetical protein
VLGVAGLVAILAKVSPADPLAAFRGGLVLVIAFFAAAGVVSAALLTRRAVPAAAPRVAVAPGVAVAQELPAESSLGLCLTSAGRGSGF